MNSFPRLQMLLLLALTGFCYHSTTANNPEYEQRRTDYINNALANPIEDAITIQAYANGTVDPAYLNSLLSGISSGLTSDFDIVQLIRVLYFTNGTYDSQILPILNSVPYWLTENEVQRTYWSENHHIMWMGSDWLLHERYGRPIDASLDTRLRHFLHMKVDYGFYEFFSSVYAPYTLAGLLNLADFAEDAEIRSLATQASKILLKEFLMLTNDKGVFFPAAGRNYFGKYENAYGQNHNNLIYLLTGFGEVPASTSHAGGFLASSSIELDDVIYSWEPELDTIYSIGHSLESSFTLNSGLSDVDRVMAQWSAGTYFHPLVALESGTLIEDSNLWEHNDFAAFAQFQSLNINDFPTLAEGASAISKSSVLMEEDIAVFKHNAVTLSSVQDYWKGKLGYQQFPLAANVGTTAVFTASGEVVDWDSRSSANHNTHLPYVKQVSNVALAMYRPDPMLSFFGYAETAVALHWKDADFDEIRNIGNWLLGRQDNGYIGVRRSCTGEINNLKACDNPEGQTWIFMVGDSAMYGSFDDFQTLIDSSQFTEEWYLDTVSDQWVYYASIDIDTITIDYAWNQDSGSTGIYSQEMYENGFSVYPNPASAKVTIDLTIFTNQPVTVRVVNALGQELFIKKQSSLSAPLLSIDTEGLAEGIYLVIAENNQQRLTEKIIIKNK